MSKKWFLYSSATKKRFDNITLDEAKNEVFAAKANLDSWLIWTEGMANWIKCSDHPSFKVESKVPQPTTPPPIPTIPDFEPKKIQLEPEQVVLKAEVAEKSESAKNWKDKRNFARFKMRLKIIITCNSKSYRTFTKDISLGGVMLEEPVPPEMVNQSCEIFLSSPDTKKSIKFSCQTVAKTDKPNRLYFTDSQFKDELERWIKSESKKPQAA